MQKKTSLQRLEESRDATDRKINGHMHYSSAETFSNNLIFCHKIHVHGYDRRTTLAVESTPTLGITSQ